MNIQIQKKNQFKIEPPITPLSQISPVESTATQPTDVAQEIENADDGKTLEKDSLPLPIEELKNNWTLFLELLMKEHSNLGAFLSLAYIGSISTDTVELKFSGDYRFQFMEVTKKHNRNEISRLLKEFVSGPVELQITLDANAINVEDTNYIKQIGNIPSTINDEIEKEPIIQTILDIFDGEILN